MLPSLKLIRGKIHYHEGDNNLSRIFQHFYAQIVKTKTLLADKSSVKFSIAVILAYFPIEEKMKRTKQQLVLNKGREKFIFRYENGQEDKLLDALIEQAKDKRTDFDWFDAAVLSFKLTQSLIGQANEILHENVDTQIPMN